MQTAGRSLILYVDKLYDIDKCMAYSRHDILENFVLLKIWIAIYMTLFCY